MKLEKREITLNEYDSLQDAYYREKTLINEYVRALTQMQRKESKDALLRLINDTAKEMFLLQDLLKSSASSGA